MQSKRIPITKQQYDKTREYVRSQTKSGELHGESKTPYKLIPRDRASNQCTTFTFRAAEHANVKEAKKYEALSPYGAAQKIKADQPRKVDGAKVKNRQEKFPSDKPSKAAAKAEKVAGPNRKVDGRDKLESNAQKKTKKM